jgi:hypothetical protein
MQVTKATKDHEVHNKLLFELSSPSFGAFYFAVLLQLHVAKLNARTTRLRQILILVGRINSIANGTVTTHEPFIGRHFTKRHWTSGVKLLCTYANFCTETELCSICEGS